MNDPRQPATESLRPRSSLTDLDAVRTTAELDRLDGALDRMRHRRSYGIGLRWQVLLTLSAVLILTIVLFGFVVLQLLSATLTTSHNRASLATAVVLADAISTLGDTADPGLTDDVAAVARTAPDANLVGVAVTVPGRVVAREAAPGHEDELAEALRDRATLDRTSSPQLAPLKGSRSSRVVAPVVRNGTPVGAVVAVFSRARLDATLATTRSLILLYLALDAVLVFIVGYFLLTRFVVRPLSRFAVATRRLSAVGDVALVEIRGSGEMAELADEFNTMARRIRMQRNKLEEQVAQLEEAYSSLHNAQTQLIRSEKLATVGRLSAGIAHEVGNPLSAVMGYLELMDDPDMAEEDRQDLLERALRETRRIDTTIRDLLDYSRAEKAEVRPHDIAPVVAASVQLVEAQPRLRGIEMQIDLKPDLPRVDIHDGRLQQVLVNLMLNAADALEGQGRIRIWAETSTNMVLLHVHDDGPGVPTDVAEHIFEPFFTTKKAGAGTGLGLAISHAIVSSFGGDLHLAPDGPGADFVIALPCANPPS